MSEFHRKIELQSPEDLQYLVATVRRAAREKLDRDLPPIEGDDPIRRRVEELVHDFITRTFTLASHNITVNGLDPSVSLLETATPSSTDEHIIEEHDAFDTKAFESLKSLAQQEEDLVEEIAMLRRKNPGVAVERAKRDFEEGRSSDEEALKISEDLIRQLETGKIIEGARRLERQDQVEANWRKGVEGLQRLKRTLPETVARRDRAVKAEEYVMQRNF